MGLGQGLLVAHPPSRAILKVGHAGDEAVVLLAPEYLYCVSIIRFSHRATSFTQTPAGCSYLYQYPEIQEKARAKRRKTGVSPDHNYSSSSPFFLRCSRPSHYLSGAAVISGPGGSCNFGALQRSLNLRGKERER